MALLDSCGSAKFTIFSFPNAEADGSAGLFARSVSVKIAGANASGVSTYQYGDLALFRNYF